MTFDLNRIARRNIRDLKPYSSARSEFSGSAQIFLDANENAHGSPAGEGLNRYPDPLQRKLKRAIGELKGVAPSRIFLGNGSDEAIDLLLRIFCEPGRDSAVICPPTYGMYEVSAAINDVEIVRADLTDDFQLDAGSIAEAFTPGTKLLFICSPNNPTGNLMNRADILQLAGTFSGVVVVDEAYIDFSGQPSLIDVLTEFPNLVVLQTFSKAWGMAGLRVGMAFADERIIDLLDRVKPPYNVSTVAQEIALEAMTRRSWVEACVDETIVERSRIELELARLPFVTRVFTSDANFILVRMIDAGAVYEYLIDRKIVVRDRSRVVLCDSCLRITVGTAQENTSLLEALSGFESGSAKAAAEAAGEHA